MSIRKVAVAGAGIMGASIAQVCAQHGYEVLLWSRGEATLEKGRRRIESNRSMLARTGDVRAKLPDLIEYSTSSEVFSQADLICETIVEDLETKREFFRSIVPCLKKNAIVTTNTSGLSINAIAEGVSDKSRFAGMHWVNPPHLIPLVEVIPGAETSDDTIVALKCFLDSLKKVAALVKKDVPGFILNRLQFALLREALHLVEDGIATPEDVDNTLKYALGIRYACCGPFETVDLGGLETFERISSYLFATLDNSCEGSALLADLAARGRFGIKSGSGFYDYSGDKAEKVIKRRDENCLRILEALSHIREIQKADEKH